jgi:hypothetical protein
MALGSTPTKRNERFSESFCHVIGEGKGRKRGREGKGREEKGWSWGRVE